MGLVTIRRLWTFLRQNGGDPRRGVLPGSAFGLLGLPSVMSARTILAGVSPSWARSPKGWRTAKDSRPDGAEAGNPAPQPG